MEKAIQEIINLYFSITNEIDKKIRQKSIIDAELAQLEYTKDELGKMLEDNGYHYVYSYWKENPKKEDKK